MGVWLALGLLAFGLLFLLLRHDTGTIAGFLLSDFAWLVAAVALLIYLGGSVTSGYRGRMARGLRDAVAWIALAALLVLLYSYRDDFMPMAQRIAGELLPGTPVSTGTDKAGERAVRIRRQVNGHFVARTMVNGVAVSMVVDTGASTVVLRPDDARKAGIDLTGLNYRVPVQTANGTSFAAPVRLRDVSVGDVGLGNVEALVAKPGALSQSLLGMSFLSRLRSYEFSGDFLTLRG